MSKVFAVAARGIAPESLGTSQSFDFDTENKTGIDLLPDEKNVLVFEPPFSTVTFYDGDPNAAEEYLKDRVSAIVSLNPWLGGWLNTKDGNLKLWYDPDGKDLAPGLFRKFGPEEVSITRSTPWEEAGKLRPPGVQVRTNWDIIDKNEAIWRVSLVLDADAPTDRFGLVVSMSRIAGDADTYYRIFNMLDINETILRMNPKRKMDFDTEIEEMMGKEEAHYMSYIETHPACENMRRDSVETREEMSSMIFCVSNNWIRDQKRLCLEQANEIRDSHRLGKMGKKMDWLLQFILPIPQATSRWLTTPLADQANKEAAFAVTSYDVVTAWFWNTLEPTVGLKSLNFRNRLPGLTNMDAGNYKESVPYTKRDYASALFIRQSYDTARRVGANDEYHPTKIWTAEDSGKATFSVSTNWSPYFNGKLDLGEGFCQGGHVPLYDPKDFLKLPSHMSFIVFFCFKPHRRAAFVVAPKSVMPKIQESEIVDEIIVQI